MSEGVEITRLCKVSGRAGLGLARKDNVSNLASPSSPVQEIVVSKYVPVSRNVTVKTNSIVM